MAKGCSHCGSKEHATKDCPHGIFLKKCGHCGSKEHATKDCPHGIFLKKCGHCGSKDHATKDCPHGMFSKKCGHCGSKDHATKDCPHGMFSKKCGHCGSKEHATKDCPHSRDFSSFSDYIIFILVIVFMILHPFDNRIKVGDYVEFGTYNGEKILWEVVKKDKDSITLWSEYILTAKCYDASESGYLTDNEVYTPETLGSNKWSNSNIREWLNSKGKMEWSTQPPTKGAINGENNYENEEGFLTDFAPNEIEKILLTERRVFDDNHKFIEKTNDYVFLASYQEVRWLGEWKLRKNDLIKLPTNQAVANDKTNNLRKGWWGVYCLMTPVKNSETNVFSIYGPGEKGSFMIKYRRNANFSGLGVVPVIRIVKVKPASSRRGSLSFRGDKSNPWILGN